MLRLRIALQQAVSALDPVGRLALARLLGPGHSASRPVLPQQLPGWPGAAAHRRLAPECRIPLSGAERAGPQADAIRTGLVWSHRRVRLVAEADRRVVLPRRWCWIRMGARKGRPQVPADSSRGGLAVPPHAEQDRVNDWRHVAPQPDPCVSIPDPDSPLQASRTGYEHFGGPAVRSSLPKNGVNCRNPVAPRTRPRRTRQRTDRARNPATHSMNHPNHPAGQRISSNHRIRCGRGGVGWRGGGRRLGSPRSGRRPLRPAS